MVALATPLSEQRSILVEKVRNRLSESGHPALRQLQVDETHGLVVVSGRVPSFYLKQLAQTLAGAVDGVHRVCNRTVVIRAA
jgi:osmotically-inducible protein OsmY